MQKIGDKQGEEIEVEWGESKGKGALTGQLLVHIDYK